MIAGCPWRGAQLRRESPFDLIHALTFGADLLHPIGGTHPALAGNMTRIDLAGALEGGEGLIEETVPTIDQAEVIEEHIVIGSGFLGGFELFGGPGPVAALKRRTEHEVELADEILREIVLRNARVVLSFQLRFRKDGGRPGAAGTNRLEDQPNGNDLEALDAPIGVMREKERIGVGVKLERGQIGLANALQDQVD